MARFNPKTGNFSGMVGNAVLVDHPRFGSILRTKPNRKYTLNEKQSLQVSKMAVVHRFLEPLKAFLNETNYEPSSRAYPYQQAVGRVLKAVDEATLTVQEEKAAVVSGSLAQPLDACVAVSDGKAKIRWTDNGSATSSNATDRLLVLFYDERKMLVHWDLTESCRSDESCTVAVTGMEKGNYLVYVAFVEKGERRASNSALAGMVEID